MPTQPRARTTVARSGLPLGTKIIFTIMVALGPAVGNLSAAGSAPQNAAKSWRLATLDTEDYTRPSKTALRYWKVYGQPRTRRNWLSSLGNP